MTKPVFTNVLLNNKKITIKVLNISSSRFLEHFILNGPDPMAMKAVLEQLSDPSRSNPQELDKAIIGINLLILLLTL